MLDIHRSEDEEKFKNSRSFGPYGMDTFRAATDPAYNHFGLVIVSCDKADLRPTPRGVEIYGARERKTEILPKPLVPRGEVIDELYDVVVGGKPPLHTGEQGLATLEICLAILESASIGREIQLRTRREGMGPASSASRHGDFSSRPADVRPTSSPERSD